MEVVSVCKLFSGSVFSVICSHAGAPVNRGRKSHRITVQLSPSSISNAEVNCQLLTQPVCSMRRGFSMDVLSSQGKFVGPFTVCGSLGQNDDSKYRVAFTSFSKNVRLPLRRRGFRRSHCRSEARVSDSSVGASDGKDISVKSVNSVPNSAETNSRDSNSGHVSSGFSSQRGLPLNLATGVGVSAAVFMMALLGFLAKPRRNGGSMADLIRRGQVRSDRGADSELLKYEDPFNNPLVKMGTKNPIVRMCGKIFRLAPVTLTDEKVAKHQNRRIQAYKWKRPIVFLNEGDPVPDGVDPEEVRWIPSNHPFATTSNYIDEDLAQKNVYQTKGVPSRLRAEHEALRRRMEETTKRDQDFQPQSTQFSEEQAWKTSNNPVEETSEWIDSNRDQGRGIDSTTTSDKQINDKGGSSSSSLNCQSQGGGSFSGETGSRLRNIDFSGEVQGSGGRDQQRYNKGGLDN